MILLLKFNKWTAIGYTHDILLTNSLTVKGYYNGVLTDINEPSINAGGQCEEGIKLILLIGNAPLPGLDSEIPGPGSVYNISMLYLYNKVLDLL